jgi:hypothetical protein
MLLMDTAGWLRLRSRAPRQMCFILLFGILHSAQAEEGRIINQYT